MSDLTDQSQDLEDQIRSKQFLDQYVCEIVTGEWEASFGELEWLLMGGQMKALLLVAIFKSSFRRTPAGEEP